MASSWAGLQDRLQHRFIRAIDVASIVSLDALVLVLVYGIISAVRWITSAEDPFFKVAIEISHGAFLLLYLAWVTFDVYDFLQQER